MIVMREDLMERSVDIHWPEGSDPNCQPTDIARGFIYPTEQEYTTASVWLIDGGTLVMA